MQEFTLEPPTTSSEHEFKVRKITSSRTKNSNTEYLVEWADSLGNKKTSWEPITHLIYYMKFVTEFRLKQLGRKPVETNSPENYFSGMAIFQIKGLIPRFLDRYQVDLISRTNRRVYTMILSAQQLRENYAQDYVKYLEASVYYPQKK